MHVVPRIAVRVAAIWALVPWFGAPAQAQEGACCLSNANCLVLSETECMLIDGTSWAGLGTDCTDFEEIGTADACETRVAKLYWLTGRIDSPHEWTLKRANLDGTEIEDLGRYPSVFVDWPSGKLYVGGGIRRLELNGDLTHSPTSESLINSSASALWVDSAEQKLYWGDATDNGIFRAGLEIPDGETADNRTDIEPVVEGTSVRWLAIVAPSDDCGRTTLDTNRDGDVDLRDFAILQNCFSGPKN